MKTPVLVLGGTGYVAGDLLRLIAAHPQLELKGVLSDSQPGEPVAKSFVHLAPIYPELKFSDLETIKQLASSLPQSAILSAAPHGVAAKLIDDVLTAAEAKGAASTFPLTIATRRRVRMKPSTSTRTVRQRASRSFRVPCRSISIVCRRGTSRIPDVLQRRCCWPACRC